MAVYKRSYRPYAGPLTPVPRRWWVITRFSLAGVFSSKLTIVSFVLALMPPLVSVLLIYAANNATIQAMLRLQGASSMLIGNKFFLGVMEVQGWLALFFTALVGPATIGPDLANNSLPLFLSRPVSRDNYVLGKLAALAIVLSAITWAPMLLLVAIEAQLSATPWLRQNWYIAPAIFLGSWLWIAVLSLVALAVSSWVKWRIVATKVIVAVLLIPAGMGAVITGVLHTKWGFLLNVPWLMTEIWTDLLRVTIPAPVVAGEQSASIPVVAAWLAMLATAAFSLFLLRRRIQARQVVRG